VLFDAVVLVQMGHGSTGVSLPDNGRFKGRLGMDVAHVYLKYV